jgi:hypothetical protein
VLHVGLDPLDLAPRLDGNELEAELVEPGARVLEDRRREQALEAVVVAPERER